MFHIAGLTVAEAGVYFGWTQILIPNPRDTNHIIKEMKKDLGKEGMQKSANIAKRCDTLLDRLLDDSLEPKEAILATLLLRYIKRIASHLKNVASSVVNPFARIGYKPKD